MAKERRDDTTVRKDARAGAPGGGAGRIEDTGTRNAGVWPASGPHPDNPDATYRGMASFGQGDRGAAGYEDHGDSEVRTVPPTKAPAASGPGQGQTRMRGAAGEPGSNAGEVDPGVGPSGTMFDGEGAGNDPAASDAHSG